MRRPVIGSKAALFALVLIALTSGASRSALGQVLDGAWDITMIVVNGRVLSANEIRSSYAADGRLTVSGNTISLLAPQNLQVKQLPILIDTTKSPAAIDIALEGSRGGHGLVIVNGDAAVLCLASPNQPRTTSFAAPSGSGNLLVSLKRVGANSPPAVTAAPVVVAATPIANVAAAAPAAPVTAAAPAAAAAAIPALPAPPAVQPPPMTLTDDQLRTMLTGTWGHRDNDTTRMMTFNADGTISANKTWNEGLANIFHTDTRSSGTWKVQNGVVIVQITASTDKDLRGQVYSYRIRSISNKELLAVDPNGQLRQEFKSPAP